MKKLFLAIMCMVSTASFAVDNVALNVDPATIEAGGETIVPVCLTNDVTICGLEFYLQLPEGVKIKYVYDEDEEEWSYAVEKGGRLKSSHTVKCSLKEDGSYYIFIYSSENANVFDSEAKKGLPLINITLVADNDATSGLKTMTFKNQILNHSNESSVIEEYKPADMNINLTVSGSGTASANMVVTDAKWGTFVAPFDVTIPEGVKAYTITGVENVTQLLLSEVSSTIPANTPVVVYSETPINKELTGASTEGGLVNGLLTGILSATNVPVGSYVLQNGVEGVKFYRVAADKQPTIKANHAYLSIASSVKSFSLDEALVTAIGKISADVVNSDYYNLSGMRVGENYKGIIISNGKKVIKK